MNKYQKALDKFLRKSKNTTILDYLLLKSLVDKATLIKPEVWGDGVGYNGEIIYDHYTCPNCGSDYELDYEQYDYCPNCGQHLDWKGIIK